MDLAARRKRLNLSQRQLATLANLDQNTVGRALKFKGDHAGGPWRTTFLALEMAITAAELDMLRHLAALHPDQVIELSTVALCPARQVAA